jgi:ATP-dependent Clp protease ATP-binding subunit ClpA
LWNNFEPELQDALSLAYNQARREGKQRISTRTFFAAVVRLRPGLLDPLLDQLPEESLPEPVAAEVPVASPILKEPPLLSTCVQNALVRLGPKVDSRHKLTSADVFVDVAKHGSGSSVARLREHGVTEERIDQMVKQLGIRVTER